MTCPACQSARVFPSRLRGPLERLRQMMTEKQPYRCHDCDRRQWQDVQVHPESPDVDPDDLRIGRAPRPVAPHELDELDPTSAGS